MCLCINVHAETNDSSIKVQWGYKGNIAPARWGQLSPQFATCATGKEQSPINITRKIIKTAGVLGIHYQPAPMLIVDDGSTELMLGDTQTIVDDGHGIQLNFPNIKEEVTWNDHAYHLVQLHIHTPSENAWHGQQFPLEIHFVHQGADGKVLVIGVLAKAGAANLALQKMIEHLPQEKGKVFPVQGEYINPYDLIPSKHNYFSFRGSLTTPPCTEGLQWVVMAEPLTASPAQIVALRKAANGANARPLQPLNGRQIFYSTTR